MQTENWRGMVRGVGELGRRSQRAGWVGLGDLSFEVMLWRETRRESMEGATLRPSFRRPSSYAREDCRRPAKPDRHVESIAYRCERIFERPGWNANPAQYRYAYRFGNGQFLHLALFVDPGPCGEPARVATIRKLVGKEILKLLAGFGVGQSWKGVRQVQPMPHSPSPCPVRELAVFRLRASHRPSLSKAVI